LISPPPRITDRMRLGTLFCYTHREILERFVVHGNPRNPGSFATRITLATAMLAVMLAITLSPAVTGAEAKVKYQLKADPSNPSAVDVSITFSSQQGEKVILAPSKDAGAYPYEGSSPAVEIQTPADSPYSVEVPSSPGGGWAVTSTRAGEVTVPYKVSFPYLNTARRDLEAPGGTAPPRAISLPDLKVFRASDVLLRPLKAEGGKPLATEYEVDVALPSGQKALVPWDAGNNAGSFSVSGQSQLLDNYITWGKLNIVKAKAAKTSVSLGYSSDYSGLSDNERKAYDNAMVALFERLTKTLGNRTGLDNLTVVLCGEKRCGLKAPASGTMLGSVVLCHGGKTLDGEAAVAAASGFFGLWNTYSLVPKAGGNAQWFQAGLPLFYPRRVAAETGLADSNDAYKSFSAVYKSYLTNRSATKVSLADASDQPDERALLAQKGAALCASISLKLQNESKSKNVKDIDTLLGAMAAKYDNLKNGETYTLADMSEMVETATGTSWDRYFEGRVRGTEAVLTSEFSATDLFGNTTSTGRPLVVGKGSGKSWIYLVIAIVIIMLVPIVFNTYVKRAVSLDLSMPKILPDDDDD